MKSKTKIGVKTASGQARFKLLTSTAMVAMALASMSAVAGPGTVTTTDGKVIGTYYANSPQLRKFVDTLPGLTAGNSNTFNTGKTGEYIPLAVADTSTYPGSEYFIIGVVEHEQWMHSDLQKPTTLRSYVQLYPQGTPTSAMGATAVGLTYPGGAPIYWPGTTTKDYAGDQVYGYDKPHYLGPIILTVTGTPVRTTMVNLLPIGRATVSNGSVTARNGDMFLPVDESLGGAGLTPAGGGRYTQNRVAFHLHGGDSPWISDGTPHQWITPAADVDTPTTFRVGNRMMNVPDMPFPGEGSQTIFWPNDQSARLMWYHDHTFGLTRQNAYAGEAAGYVIMDAAELALLGLDASAPLATPTETARTVNGQSINKAIPNALLDQIVLIVQDKTFVPDDIATQDSKWDTAAWGKPGDLWYPHVYEPFQLWGTTAPSAGTDPATVGVNPAGRWDYAVNDATGNYLPPSVGATRNDPDYGQVAFPDGTYAGGPSATPESYMDTAMVNGVAYPTLTVDPKAYRVRFLNGANDRYWNLSLFVADDQQTSADGRNNTEVKMIPEQVGINGLSNMNPVTGEIFVGTGYHYPKVTIAGEGGNGTGATASAVVNSAGEITYLNLLKRGSGYVNPTVTIVDYASAAERAAAEVDSTVPATGTGTGAQGFAFSVARPEGIPDPSTAGPDIIQFANEAGFLPKPVLHKAGPVTLDFAGTEVSAGFYLGGAERADTVIDFSQYAGKTLILYNDSTAPVPGGDPRYDYFTGNPDQTAAGGAPTTQPGYGPNTRTVMQIVVNAGTPASAYDASGNGGALATELPKAYAAVADKHVVGSVDAATGAVTGALPKALDTVNSKLTLADNTVVPLEIKTIHGFTDPNLGRLIAQLGTELPGSNGTPTPLGYIDAPTDIIAAGDTQYWWIKNYDVDNHPMHFHLFNVQVLARLDHATGVMRAPEPNEAGWKETVKNWPGEDVIVALAPKTPALPFGLPNSKRTLDPTLPDGSTANEVLYGQSNADPAATKPVPFAFAQTDLDPFVRSNGKVVIDSTGKPTKNTHYGQASSATIANTPLDFGWEYVWHCHILGHEENDLMRPMVYLPNIVASAAVTGVSFDKATGVLSWTDPTPALDANSAPVGNTKGNVQNEIGFRVERAVVTSNAVVGTFTPLTANSPVVDSRVNTLANATSFKDVPAANTDYQYRVVAVNEAGETISTAVASLAQAPVAATSLTVAALTARTLTLNWVDASSNEEGFSVESSVDNGATWTSVTGSPLLPNVTTLAVTGLLPTTTYLFRVASTKTGYVPQYATVSATTPIELLAPAVTLKSTTDPVSGVVQVAVSWTDTSTGETGYTVERCTGTTAACAKATAIWTMLAPNLAAGSTSYVDTPTTAGTTYVYRVRAINGATLGPVGTSAQVVASPVVAAPTGLLASTATGAVVLTWTDASTNETAFNILRSPQGAGTFVQVGTVAKNIVTFTDATVGSGIAYDYKVVAVYTTTTSTSTSAASNIATVTSPLIAAPVVAANVAAGTMVLNWVDNTNNETAYQITRTDGAGAAVVFTTPNRSTTLKSATGAAVTYTDTTAVPNVAYSYTVKAIVSATAVLPVVVGEPSNSVPATVVMAAPGAPTAALTSATKITVTWADNSNNETGFVVERSTDGATWTKLLLATQAYSVKAGTAATASYVDTLVAPAAPSTYQYRVSAVKQTGTGLAAITTASAAQSAVAVVDYSVPLAPTILPATPGATTTVNVAWTDNATNETGFSVQRATDAAFTKSLSTKTAAGAVTGPTGSYLATGLTAGKVYYFRVAATNAVGTSAYSTAVSITVP